MNEFEKLRLALRYWLTGREYFSALKAMEYAASYHKGFRKDNITPEFHHQISIASYIRTLPSLIDVETTITTAFLHDVVEDYNVALVDITNRFGNKVSDCVKLLTKHYLTPEELYYHNISNNPICSVVKGADRIHNVQTMNGVFSSEKKKQYVNESSAFVLPMLKDARRNFPEQESAYENIKLVLNSQIALIDYSLVNDGLG